MTLIDYCQQKAVPPGSNLYYSLLFYPQRLQQSLQALHAFSIEIEQIIEECSDPGVARIKLQWWYEEIQRTYAGQARHPVGKSFNNLDIHHVIPEEMLHQYIMYSEQLLTKRQPENYSELINYLRQGPGLIWRLSADLCCYHDQKTPEHVSDIGCSIAILEIIRNAHRSAQHNRILLPKDEMDSAKITVTDLHNSNSKKMNEFYILQINRLIEQLDYHYLKFPGQDRLTQLGCLIMNRLVVQICKEMTLYNYNLHKQMIALTPLRKLWIAWLTKRQAKKPLINPMLD